MQPLHYDLRDPDAKDNSITHAAVATSNLDAAIPMRFATTASRNAKNYAHRNNHSLQDTEEEPIASGTTAAAPAAQTRYLSSVAAATLHGKTQGFVLGFLPKTEPLQHHAAITMRSASTDSKTPYNYAHTSTPKAA